MKYIALFCLFWGSAIGGRAVAPREMTFNERFADFGDSKQHRRTHASLPVFSKSAKRKPGHYSNEVTSATAGGQEYYGYGGNALGDHYSHGRTSGSDNNPPTSVQNEGNTNLHYSYYFYKETTITAGYYGYNYYHPKSKSSKKGKGSKSSKKEKGKKDGKSGKKGKYVLIVNPTKVPTPKPVLHPGSHPTPVPTLPTPGGSGSEDMTSSEDCPPARPPAVIPPAPTSSVGTQKPSVIKEIDRTKLLSVGLDIYAIDYTLSKDDRTPIKVDFLELQTVTQSFFKDFMLEEYKMSTQSILVDFTTTFVTAHFTPGDPVHIQYNSTAYFSKDSISIPKSETLSKVLEQSLANPKPYISDLQTQLSDVNPFSSTTNAVFTIPKAAPMARSSVKSTLKIASAGVAVIFTLTLVAGVVILREGKNTDEELYEKHMHKDMSGDVTVAGETYMGESQISSSDSSLSISSSRGSDQIINDIRRSAFSTEKKRDETKGTSQIRKQTYGSFKKPRTAAEIWRLLSSKEDNII